MATLSSNIGNNDAADDPVVFFDLTLGGECFDFGFSPGILPPAL